LKTIIIIKKRIQNNNHNNFFKKIKIKISHECSLKWKTGESHDVWRDKKNYYKDVSMEIGKRTNGCQRTWNRRGVC
jgi:hypothetical protein